MPTKPKTFGQVMRRLNPHTDATDANRLSSAKRGYGRRWRRLRRAFLAVHPLCEECLSRFGRDEPATEVHHIVPRAEGGKDTEANLQALCKSCHSRTTGGERR